MQAVQRARGHRALTMALTLMAITVALVLSGLTGYLVRGSTTVITRTTVAAPLSGTIATAGGHPRALNGDSSSGCRETTSAGAPPRALNSDSTSGY